MNSKITAFLEKFRVKESNNLIDPENFEAKGFSIMGSTPAISQKWTFFSCSPQKPYSSYCYLKWDIKSKN